MSHQPEPLVSVVVPFFNTARFLDTCIESILRQHYQSFELILSDNQSDDGSGAIAESWARQDPRVRYVPHDAFVEQVPNYNRALGEISPQSAYTKIVQADDWIAPECLRKMVDIAERHPSVGVISSYTLKGSRIANVGLSPDHEVFNGREVCRRQLLGGEFFMGSPTSVMYRSEIVRERTPFFSLDRLHEDTEACYEILRTWDFGFVHQVLSFARVRGDSISAAGEARDPHILDKLILVHRFGPSFLDEAEYRLVSKRYGRRYYRFLGRRLLAGRTGADFWAYHRKGLATVDERLDGWQVAAGALKEATLLLLRPVKLGRSLRARWTRAMRNPPSHAPDSKRNHWSHRQGDDAAGDSASGPA